MADRYGVMGKSSKERSVKDEEFQEEDVWGVMEKDNNSFKIKKSKDYCVGSSAWRPCNSVPITIPKAAHNPTIPEDNVGRQSSASLDIPDWSKIYGKSVTDCYHNGGDGKDSAGNGFLHHDIYSDDDDDDDNEDMVPPHEYLAKRLARSQISSFSVCEGIGRTLKGRDLSKVRNAILTKTGFLE